MYQEINGRLEENYKTVRVVVRVVKIRTKNGEYVLPTVKIYLLEGITNEIPQGGR